MKTKIETTELLDYIELYNKYEYLIERNIMKICPRFISNEDFIQDAKLGLLEYIEHNECFNKLNTCSSRTSYVSRYMYTFILRLCKKYTESKANDPITYLDSTNTFIDTRFDNIDIIDSINKALSTLTEHEAKIIRLRFYDNMTIANIASMEGLTNGKIRLIEQNALRKLRHPSRSRALKVYMQK